MGRQAAIWGLIEIIVVVNGTSGEPPISHAASSAPPFLRSIWSISASTRISPARCDHSNPSTASIKKRSICGFGLSYGVAIEAIGC